MPCVWDDLEEATQKFLLLTHAGWAAGAKAAPGKERVQPSPAGVLGSGPHLLLQSPEDQPVVDAVGTPRPPCTGEKDKPSVSFPARSDMPHTIKVVKRKWVEVLRPRVSVQEEICVELEHWIVLGKTQMRNRVLWAAEAAQSPSEGRPGWKVFGGDRRMWQSQTLHREEATLGAVWVSLPSPVRRRGPWKLHSPQLWAAERELAVAFWNSSSWVAEVVNVGNAQLDSTCHGWCCLSHEGSKMNYNTSPLNFFHNGIKFACVE